MDGSGRHGSGSRRMQVSATSIVFAGGIFEPLGAWVYHGCWLLAKRVVLARTNGPGTVGHHVILLSGGLGQHDSFDAEASMLQTG